MYNNMNELGGHHEIRQTQNGKCYSMSFMWAKIEADGRMVVDKGWWDGGNEEILFKLSVTLNKSYIAS